MYKKYNNYINLICLKAYAIMVIAKKDIISMSTQKRKPQSVTSGAFFWLVVTVVFV